MNTVSLELQPCLGSRSGVGTYAYELARSLKNTDEFHFQGNVFNFLGRHDHSQFSEELHFPLKQNLTVPYSLFRGLQQIGLPSYSRIFGQSDINLFFNYIVPPGVSGRVVTTVHDMAYIRYPGTLKPRNLYRLRAGMESSQKRADRIITISEFSKSEICALLDISPDRIDVVNCAAPDRAVPADFRTTAEKYGIKKPYFLFVGTIEPRKNLSNLLQAFDLFRARYDDEYALVLAGGSGWQNKEIFGTYEAMRFKDDVIFTGYVSDKERVSLYSNASLFIFPSVYEGFGIPPLEAMLYGCPVASSDAASMPEVLGDAAAFFNPDDQDMLAERMRELTENPEVRESLVHKGYSRVEKYSWSNSAKQLLEVCRKALL